MTGTLDLEPLVRIESIRIRLNVKVKKDSGNVFADVNDVGGTPVTFEQSFIDIRSIITTAQLGAGGVPLVAIYDFVDVPNPTGFTVYVYRLSDGVRVSGDVSWQAEGF